MDLNEISVFTKVAQTGSFTAAAHALAMPKSTVSRKVSLLEQRLGVSLLKRTTRKLSLTDAGASYFRRCSQLLTELQEAETAAVSSQSEPQGKLRITAPVEFGHTLLGAISCRFIKAYPKVELDFMLTDRIVDLVGEGVDLALRAGDLDDSSLIGRKLGSDAFVLYASPQYLKKHGKPTQPKQLSEHTCLHFTALSDKPVWELTSKTSGKQKVTVHAPVSSNSIMLLRSLAVASAGIVLLPNFVCTEDIQKGNLVRVLPEWNSGSGPIYLVYPQSRFVAPKIRAFIDFMLEHGRDLFQQG